MKLTLVSAALAILFGGSSAFAAPTELCREGTSFKRECNTCRCDAKSGRTQCTLMKCTGTAIDRCPSGTTFKRECNTCRCDAKTGSVACTKMSCVRKRADTDRPTGAHVPMRMAPEKPKRKRQATGVYTTQRP